MNTVITFLGGCTTWYDHVVPAGDIPVSYAQIGLVDIDYVTPINSMARYRE